MAYYSRTRIERVAEALSELRYTEMQALGRALAEIANDRPEFQPTEDADFEIEPKAMADLVADWAEGTEMEVASATQAAKDKN